jgi:hypothetical protein
MQVGDLVRLEKRLQNCNTPQIGIIKRVVQCWGHRFHILWNDGSEVILGYDELEKV